MAKKHSPRSELTSPIFDEPVFSEGVETPDPSRFSTRHPSDNATFEQIKNLLTKRVVPFDRSRIGPKELFPLKAAFGSHADAVESAIRSNNRIVFHCGGDSGASDVRKYRSEIRVFDQIADDCHTSRTNDRPSFLLHLGDLVYNFGESIFYYDQFYEPNRNYPGPIFAIPGNHDSFVVPGTAVEDRPLTVFQRNFCAEEPVVTTEARSLTRTAMIQPGVYYALDAPFVRVLCLFSNALEDPGVISSQGGKWALVPDFQLEFLAAQLKRVKDESYGGALLLAVHHPPFSYSPQHTAQGSGGSHGSSLEMLRDIDRVCKDAGVYPHAVISGHAHNYQRYTRTVKLGRQSFDVPFIVCGDMGHNVNPIVRGRKGQPPQLPDFGSSVDYLDKDPAIDASGLLLEKYNDRDFGYLRVAVDAQQLRIAYHTAQSDSLAQSRFDLVTVDLSSHTMVSN
jgi:Calcineurin-like phosphoesterase